MFSEDLHQSISQGSISPNFRGVEKFFAGDRAIMMVFFAIAVLLAGTGVLLNGDSAGDFVGGTFVLTLGYFVYFKLWVEEQKYLHFIMWLDKNKNRLYTGEVLMYDHSQISLQTKLVHFEACFSIIILTVRLQSRFIFPEKESKFIVGFLYTVFTFLCGWWGIPWGPVFTIKIIFKNIFGGKEETVKIFLEKLKLSKI